MVFDLDAQRDLDIGMDIRAFDAFDAFLSGNYHRSLMIVDAALSDIPDDFDLMEIGARSMALLGSSKKNAQLKSAVGPIVSLMSTVLAKSTDAEEAAEELTKIAWNLSGRRFGYRLLSFVLKEMSPNPLDTSNVIAPLASLLSREFHPLQLINMDDKDLISRYATAFGERFGFERPSRPLLPYSLLQITKWFASWRSFLGRAFIDAGNSRLAGPTF